MKRTLPTLLLALLAAPLWAQSSDNRLTLSVVTPPGSHEAVLTLSLDNPTVALTAVEAYLTLPDDVSLGQGTLDAAHCAASHALTEGVVGGRLFVSVASPALDTFTEMSIGSLTYCKVPDLEKNREILRKIFKAG